MSRLVQPKNTLKEKVGEGGFKAEDLKKAQTAIEENEVDFVPIASKFLEQIHASLKEHEQNQSDKNLYGKLLDPLTQLRAQGSMFHYPSITRITDIVVDLLDSLHKVDPTIIEIVQAYEKSAKVLLASGIKSDQDKVCIALSQELQNVCQKYKDKK